MYGLNILHESPLPKDNQSDKLNMKDHFQKEEDIS